MKPGLQSSLKQAPRGNTRFRCVALFSAIAGGGLWAASACQAQAISNKTEAALPHLEFGASTAPAPGAAPERGQTHMKLWFGGQDGRLGVGIGRIGPEVGLASAATTGAPHAASWSWSVRRDLGSDSRVMLEQIYAPGVATQSGPRDLRLALELKPNDALKRFGVSRDSLMRVPLSGTWSLSMRPRSGGISLMLRTPL